MLNNSLLLRALDDLRDDINQRADDFRFHRIKTNVTNPNEIEKQAADLQSILDDIELIQHDVKLINELIATTNHVDVESDLKHLNRFIVKYKNFDTENNISKLKQQAEKSAKFLSLTELVPKDSLKRFKSGTQIIEDMRQLHKQSIEASKRLCCGPTVIKLKETLETKIKEQEQAQNLAKKERKQSRTTDDLPPIQTSSIALDVHRNSLKTTKLEKKKSDSNQNLPPRIKPGRPKK